MCFNLKEIISTEMWKNDAVEFGEGGVEEERKEWKQRDRDVGIELSE